jgi:hypothetical protein
MKQDEEVDWIWLAQDRGKWRAIVSEVTKIGFCKMRRISKLSNELEASEEGPCYSMLTDSIAVRHLLFLLFLYSLNLKKEAVYSAETSVIV